MKIKQLTTMLLGAALCVTGVACRSDRANGVGGGPPANTQATAQVEPAPILAAPVKVTAVRVTLDPTIATACGIATPHAFFEYDSAKVREEAEQRLDNVASCLKDGGALAGRKIMLVGHADPRGPAEYNASLARERAGAVKQELEERGISVEERVETHSMGERLAEEEPKGWPIDRRVDLLLGP